MIKKLSLLLAVLCLLITFTSCEKGNKNNDIEITDPARVLVYVEDSFDKIYDPSIGENEEWYINDHCFIKKDDKWHLFGITQKEPAKENVENEFAHATADELTQSQYEKLPNAMKAEIEKNEYVLWAPYIYEHEGIYYMYYCAGGDSPQTYQIHLATSIDLEVWDKSDANPLLIDGFDARDPMVIKYEDEWILYYTANSTPAGGNHVVKCVTSSDLVHWSDTRTVFTHERRGSYGGPTESPFVFEYSGYYLLFIGPSEGYANTAVYISDDPYDFENKPQVGSIASHAPEIVRENGKIYISHCGWGAGGVYMSELTIIEIADGMIHPLNGSE